MSQQKVYNGSSWLTEYQPKSYNGSSWDSLSGTIKRWNGGEWEVVWPLGRLAADIPDILWAGLSTITLSDTDPEAASCSVNLISDGTTTKVGSGTAPGNWLSETGAGLGASFECRIVGNSQAFGPTSWTSLSSNQSFSLNGVTDKSDTFTIEIRPVDGVAESRSVNLSITVTGGSILQ